MKTQMCRFYPTGQCKFGKDCCFAHTNVELSEAPDLKKTSMCKNWQEGKCMLPSDKCPYAHGPGELRVTPAFVQKKLSRRTREAHDSSNPQDGEEEEDMIDRTTTASSPLRRAFTTSTCSGLLTPRSPAPSTSSDGADGSRVPTPAGSKPFAVALTGAVAGSPGAHPAPAGPYPPEASRGSISDKPVLCLSNILGDGQDFGVVLQSPMNRMQLPQSPSQHSPKMQRQQPNNAQQKGKANKGPQQASVDRGPLPVGSSPTRAFGGPPPMTSPLAAGFLSPGAGLMTDCPPSPCWSSAPGSPTMQDPVHILRADSPNLPSLMKLESTMLEARRSNLPVRIEVDSLGMTAQAKA